MAIARYISKNKDRAGKQMSLADVSRFANLATTKAKREKRQALMEEIQSLVDDVKEADRVEALHRGQEKRLKDVLSNQDLDRHQSLRQLRQLTDKLDDITERNDKLWSNVTFAQDFLSEKIDGVLSNADKICEKTDEDLKNMSAFFASGHKGLTDDLQTTMKSFIGRVEKVEESVLSALPKEIEQEQIMIEETGQIITVVK